MVYVFFILNLSRPFDNHPFFSQIVIKIDKGKLPEKQFGRMADASHSRFNLEIVGYVKLNITKYRKKRAHTPFNGSLVCILRFSIFLPQNVVGWVSLSSELPEELTVYQVAAGADALALQCFNQQNFPYPSWLLRS